MSMEVQLIRLGDGLMKDVRANPELIEDLVFDSDGGAPAGFDRDKDLWEGSYLHFFAPYFEHVASEAGDDPDDLESSEAVVTDPFYRAVNGVEELAYEFCYGPATVHTPESVKALVEEWGADFDADDREDTDRLDVTLFLFYEGAAKAGQSVICGIA